jgi:hypothetical protein
LPLALEWLLSGRLRIDQGHTWLASP